VYDSAVQISGSAMATSGSKIRLFVNEGLKKDESITLRGMQCHYLVHVMRTKAGDRIALFNGEDGEWQACVDRVGKNDCSLDVEDNLRPQGPEIGPWLAFAPLKKTRTQFVVEKATELGASRLWPVFTGRTTTDRVNLQRLRAHAIEAAEQCDRLTVPIVSEPSILGDLAAAWPDDRELLVMDCGGHGRPLLDAMTAIGTRVAEGRQQPPGLLVGPEGGFAKTELDDLAALPFATAVALGPRILRAETAALSALACWQAVVESQSKH
jgi:16S rRNA (uracil1498-N3)-methyltransferase